MLTKQLRPMQPGSMQSRKIGYGGSAALAGVSAVALLLVGGRWGSYLGVPGKPLFLTDLLLFAALLHAGAAGILSQRNEFNRLRFSLGITLSFTLCGWGILRFVIGWNWSQAAIRDFVPYGYAFVALLAGHSYVKSGVAGRARTVRILCWALILHLCWVIIALLSPGLADRMPLLKSATGAVRILDIRSDFDGALVGALSGICLLTIFRRRRLVISVLAYAICWLCVIMMHSRAALIATIACNFLVVCAAFRRVEVSQSRKAGIILLIPIVLMTGLFVLPHTGSGARLIGTIDPAAAPASQASSAQGTMLARWSSWQQLWEYSTAEVERFTIGVGFGPDFMRDSGALTSLMGNADLEYEPRSPHNYLLGSMLRLGVLGALLVAGLWSAVIFSIRSKLTQLYDDPLLGSAAVLATSLIPIALLGVVFESPFGAVPFFWCVGVLCSNGRQIDFAAETA